MQDQNTSSADNAETGAAARPRRRRAVSRAAGPPAPDDAAVEASAVEVSAVEASTSEPETTASDAAAAPAPRRRSRKAAATKPEAATAEPIAAGDANVETVADTAPRPDTGQPGTESPDAAPRKRASRARKTAAVAAEAASISAQPTAAGAAAPPATGPETEAASEAPRARTPRKRTARSRTAPVEAPSVEAQPADTSAADAQPADTPAADAQPADTPAADAQPADAQPADAQPADAQPADAPAAEAEPQSPATQADAEPQQAQGRPARRRPAVLFQPPTFEPAPAPAAAPEPPAAPTADEAEEAEEPADIDTDEEASGRRRRRRRGGRGRRRRPDEVAPDDEGEDGTAAAGVDAASAAPIDGGLDTPAAADVDADTEGGSGSGTEGEQGEGGSRRRRRRRKRTGDAEVADTRPDDPPNTVVKVREARDVGDEVTSVKGSTRLEAKKQRRREGREAGRRRPPILSEAEFLARREAVDRVMTVRQSGDLTQIAVLEDGVLVEHHVSRASQQSLIGNVYLGRVQNVLPAMEAAFVDIGRGRNAVIYAGEVDWSLREKADGHKRIEDVLKSGQSVLVQVTKDPIGHKGARLTSQISLPGRYVVYVPGGSMSGISRKLPDTERNRLKKVLKDVVPEDAGVIVRTAAEGATEEELTNDVTRLQAQWEAIQKKVSGTAPALLHGEPDLAIKVVRDLFNEDFTKLVVSGDGAWSTIEEYVTSVAGSLRNRVEKWTGTTDLFAAHRVDEQIAKALDRKVWLPSGGSLIIDRTEAMTVVDVNTGKFTGSGGNLEETVTKNNLEAAEEIVRQLRLRDIGGIIVIDFIDMVLEANRDLVLRRLVECLGRDRTKHQVAEVTSLGLVQMTRKRIGIGLLEAFSETCPHCNGRGVLIHTEVVDGERAAHDHDAATGRSDRRGRRRQSEPVEKAPADEAVVVPKLEAMASPGEASPADLHPAGASASAPAPAPSAEAGPEAGPELAPEPAAVAAPQAAAEPGPEPTPQAAPEPVVETAPVPPRPRRGRRRAQRPAGSPDVVQVTDPVGS